VEVTLLGGVRWPFVEMTLNMMRRFGDGEYSTNRELGRIGLAPRRHYSLPAGQFQIESDATAASYFIVLPIVVGGTIQITDYHFYLPMQGDVRFSELLQKHQLISGLNQLPSKPTHQIRAGSNKHGIEADFSKFSDTFLTLAAIAPLLNGPTRITGIAHTRKQETDRVAGMARELTRLGQHVIETEDSLEIHPRPLRSGETIETYGDHRFAMSFGILGCHDLHGDGRSWLTIRNPACCAKTFPHFFELLESLRQKSLAT